MSITKQNRHSSPLHINSNVEGNICPLIFTDDPRETKNLATDPDHSNVLQELTMMAEKYNKNQREITIDFMAMVMTVFFWLLYYHDYPSKVLY